MRIVWSPLAVDRVSEIAEYISRDKPGAARNWVDNIFKAVGKLEKLTKSGRPLPETRRDDIREVLYGHYRIIYRIKQNTISILTVRHGQQILPEEELD